MTILIIPFSIIVITTLVWLFNKAKILTIQVCPVCAGVSGTWFWVLVGMALGQLSVSDFRLPVSILMGGSVVGIMYQLEKRKNNVSLVWKTAFLIIGFSGVYALVNWQWLAGLAAIAVLAALAVVNFRKHALSGSAESAAARELEEKMKKCC